MVVIKFFYLTKWHTKPLMIIRMNWNVYLIIMYCTCYDFPPSVNHASKCHVQWHFSASNPNNITSQLEPVLRVRRGTVNLCSPKCLHIIARVPTSGTATIPFNSKGPSHGTAAQYTSSLHRSYPRPTLPIATSRHWGLVNISGGISNMPHIRTAEPLL